MNTFITLFSIAAAAQAATTHLTTCGGNLNVTEAEVNSRTVYPGDDVTLTLKIANGYKPITDGLIYYHISGPGLDDIPQVDELCDVIACPIRFGRHTIRLDLTVPQSSSHMRLEITTRTLDPLLCVHLEIENRSWLRSVFAFGERIPLIAPPPIALTPVFGRVDKDL